MQFPSDDRALWIKLGKWSVGLFLAYYLWHYVVLILAVCGGYYLWQEWKKYSNG